MGVGGRYAVQPGDINFLIGGTPLGSLIGFFVPNVTNVGFFLS